MKFIDQYEVKTPEQILSERTEWRKQVTEFAGADAVIIDPEDDIVCDSCNADCLESPNIYSSPFQIICETCFEELKNETQA